MRWCLSHRFDPRALPMADRHYNRQKPGSPQFVPPSTNVVLLTPETGEAKALWVSIFQKYVQHRWPGAWMCSCFRNEGAGLSSELIVEAMAVTVWKWGNPPPLGMVTFVNAEKTRRNLAMSTPSFNPKLQLAEIVAAALNVTRTSLPEVCGRGRAKEVVLARLAIVVVARRQTYYSYPDIARECSRVNHSSAIGAYQRYESDPGRYADLIEQVEQEAQRARRGQRLPGRTLGPAAAKWEALA